MDSKGFRGFSGDSWIRKFASFLTVSYPSIMRIIRVFFCLSFIVLTVIHFSTFQVVNSFAPVPLDGLVYCVKTEGFRVLTSTLVQLGLFVGQRQVVLSAIAHLVKLGHFVTKV